MKATLRSSLAFGLLLVAAFFGMGALSRWRQAPRLEISPVVDVGELVHDQELALTIGFRNGGGGTLKVSPPIPGCNCASAKLDREEFGPGEIGEFSFTLRPASAPGKVYSQGVVVPSNDPRQPQATITIRGKMRDELESQPKVIRVAKLAAGEQWERRCVIRCTDPAASMQIKTVSCDLPDVKTTIDAQAEQPTVIVEQTAPERTGTAFGHLTVTTNHYRFHEIVVPVEIEVASRLSVSPPRLLLRSGKATDAHEIVVTSAESFELNAADSATSELEIELTSDGDRRRWTIGVRPRVDREITKVERDTLRLVVGGIDSEEELVIPIIWIPRPEALADASTSH